MRGDFIQFLNNIHDGIKRGTIKGCDKVNLFDYAVMFAVGLIYERKGGGKTEIPFGEIIDEIMEFAPEVMEDENE